MFKKTFAWLGVKLDAKDLWPLLQVILIKCFNTVIYDDLKALARKAEFLPELKGKGKLEAQILKWTWVVKEFIKSHDEYKEWDADLDIMLNIAIKEVKGKLGGRFKLPKWLRF